MTAEPDLPTLRREGDVFVLDLGDGENRFNPSRNAALLEALDAVARTPVPRALVTTATGKIWSNGLDLDFMGAHPESIQECIDGLHRLLAAFLGAGVPTVAAVQGHAFAGGAMFALAHDAVVMRADRGYWCLPEVDLGMPFTPGMTALIRGRLAPRAAHDAMTSGRRYGGEEARAAGIVDAAVPFDDVLPVAMQRAQALAGKGAETLATIKARMYGEALESLRTSAPVL